MFFNLYFLGPLEVALSVLFIDSIHQNANTQNNKSGTLSLAAIPSGFEPGPLVTGKVWAGAALVA